MRLRSDLLGVLVTLLTATTIWAGGSGLNIAVIVNQNSSNSVQLANDYCEQRNVPPQNVLFITNQFSGGTISCSANEFQTELLAPLLNMLQARNLTNQIQFVLLSMDFPYQVYASNGLNSSTSAFLYGFKPDGEPIDGYASCSLPDNSTNSYSFSELPFELSLPNTAETNSFLAVMLTDTNLANAELTLARGVAGDSTFPTQSVYLAKTDDTARNVRFPEFDNAIFQARLRRNYSILRTNTDSTSFTNLLGFETGLANYTEPTNAFVPGAMADSLTSYSGNLFQNTGQTPILAYLEAGAAGSYGTVIEPCNYTQKFPNPLDYFYQARGFCMAEAYYQSVQNPYQGITVGEPLSAPFAQRGEGLWSLPAGTPVLSGSTNLHVQFSAAATNLPLSQVDLFVDGTWFETVTNLPPAPGDKLAVTLSGISNTYVVPANASLGSVALGLASMLNAVSNNTQVAATAYGDRIELHSLNPLVPGADVTLEAQPVSATTLLSAAAPSFLDSIAIGYHYMLLSNSPAVGDWLQLSVTKTNGTTVTLAVTNTTSGSTIAQLLTPLFNTVNNTPALQSPDGIYAADFDDYTYAGIPAADWTLYAQTPGWPASAIQVTLTASPDIAVLPSGPSLLQDNLSDLQARNHLYVSSGKLFLPLSWTLNTTNLPDGCHELTAVAYEGASVRTQTSVTQNVRIQNTSLTANLNTLYGGSNTDVAATLQFSVTASNKTISSTELFSTGGPLGIVSNQATALFSVSGSSLGVGLHPFYAIVTDTSGDQYRTATTSIRLIGPEPPIEISVTPHPLTLTWSATAGRDYYIIVSTNILGPFQTNATVIPSNSVASWVDTNASPREKFYEVEAAY